MGHVRNHTIVVVSELSYAIEAAHAEAVSIFDYVSPISPPAVNCSRSFFIPPDGSKEGWPESRQGDEQRWHFKKWLKQPEQYAYWVEVYFGGDDERAAITDDSTRCLEEA